jgi:phosphoglycerate kinase
MGFNKKTIRDIDLKGKRVLLRADYNVPVSSSGMITDDYRIKQSIPTIQYLLDNDCRVIICSHLGRPDGKPNKAYGLKPVASKLTQLLSKNVAFSEDCVGPAASAAARTLAKGQVLLLENLRFHLQEEKNDDGFAKELAKLADVFVEDGFGVVHRAHASTEAITHHLPSVAGLLLEKEVSAIIEVMENPKRPLMAIIGGAKISDKIGVLTKFIDIADVVAVGGAMANTFLLAEGIKIGKSLTDKDEIPLAKQLIQRAKEKSKKQQFIFYLPQDGVVAKKIDKTATTRIVDWSANVVADIENYPKRPPNSASLVGEDEMILDIGPFSGAFIAGTMQLANTVVWNGAMGVTETPGLAGPIGPFAHGTDLVIEAILGQFGHKPFSLVGGGDTVGYIEQRKLTRSFNHVSTGGGASLELMAGKKLPGIEALQAK